jgi:cysteine desulfurase
MIYLDNHSTTPVDPRVLEAMLPYFTQRFGNAHSVHHAYGWDAKKAVDEAREKIAALIHARPDEIVFTSGATEADNLAIQGRVVTVATEHRAVLDKARTLEHTIVPVDRDGLVDPDEIRKAVDDRTQVVSVMIANNEIGVLQPVGEIGKICRERGVLFHSDGAQAVGKVPVDVEAMNLDLLSISAHKIYGPKGVGALYVRKRPRRVRLQPLLHGGGHEDGLRSGTLPVPLIVGFGRAAELADDPARIRALRDRLWKGISENLDQVRLNGHAEKRLPGNLNVAFAHVNADRLLRSMDEVAASTAAACSSAKIEPSHVLAAIGLPEPLAYGSVRFGIGRFNTQEEIDRTVELLVKWVRRLREESPLYV